ncbi:MAG TPA: hypothetical protein VMF69_26145 [Gemmataceae bacterium]|nr:hypothetical protein [Gemmataceae bacterium]
MIQPQREPDLPMPDSSNTFVLVQDDEGESYTLPPLDPHYPQETLKGQTVDSYGVDREKIAKVKQLAIHLGRQKADLIREGLDLVLEKYRDQLGDLLASEPPSGEAKPENGVPSA